MTYAPSARPIASRLTLIPAALATALWIAAPVQAPSQKVQGARTQPSTAPPAAPSRGSNPRTPGVTTQSAAPPKTYTDPTHPTPRETGNKPRVDNGGSSTVPLLIGLGAALAAIGTYEAVKHHNADSAPDNTPEDINAHAPKIPNNLNMCGFAIKGLARANWPIVLDFVTDSPGSVEIDVDTKAHHFAQVVGNPTGQRGYRIVHLPDDFDPDPEDAVYRISFVPSGGAPQTGMGLRTYGLGAGFKAVGSVSIDELTFQPATVHPRQNEVASYSFHAHSAFDGVEAAFVTTSISNGQLVTHKDKEQKVPPVDENELAQRTWDANGKNGDHMLQIKAWRGLENGGDWVVAWSPDIVDVVR